MRSRLRSRVAQSVATNNYSNVKADKDLGIITAGVAVIMGEGSEAPLNVIVKREGDGLIRVEANFATAGGQSAAKKTVREELCKLVEAAVD